MLMLVIASTSIVVGHPIACHARKHFGSSISVVQAAKLDFCFSSVLCLLESYHELLHWTPFSSTLHIHGDDPPGVGAMAYHAHPVVHGY